MIAKMSALMSRSLRIDESTAQFYLRDAGGDIKAAIRLAEQDQRWEAQLGRARAAPRRARSRA